MPINPNIALGVQPIQVADPMARYSQFANIQNAQNQNALAQYQLSTAQREQESVNALNQAYASAYDPATGKINTNLLREKIAQSGFGSKLPGIEKTLVELDKERSLLEKTQGEVKAQPTALAKQQTDLLDAKLKQSRSFLDTLNPADPNAPAAYLRWHEANHADPLIGPALKARGVTIEQSRAQIDAAIAKGPQAFADLINGSKLGTEKFMELNKPTTTTVDQGGQRQVLQTPGLGGTPISVGTYADVPLPQLVEAQKSRIAKAGASNITMSTEKKYGEQFAGKMADRDDAKMGAAEKAPQLAESANRIIELVNQGNLFTGPVADIKLNIARALNVAGASNEEKIANTELLISATGKSTLDAIQGAGLGTNQGFTDKDLKFLQGIAGGTIQLTAQTLTELARLQHQAAVRSVEAWSTRLKQIPKSSIEGLGISTEPIKVPPLSSVKKGGGRPEGVGANWTFESDAAGNKAWVSPDRKSFKEVK
tara:strand:+ start:804 stop:2252 length:1449 start_codon:yes stop_codon:yes gene_type:complete